MAGGSPALVWSAEDDASLAALWTEGLSIGVIAARLGVPKWAVARRRRHLGLPGRASPIDLSGKRAPRPSRAGQPRRRTNGREPRPYRRKAEQAPSVPAPPPAPVAPHPSMRFGATGCRWPMGEPRTPGFRFCDAPEVVLGKPYCAECCARAYIRPELHRPGPEPLHAAH